MDRETTRDAVLAKVEAWDLEGVKRRLVANESWSERLANETDPIYRRFMALHEIQTDEILIPPTTIDTFWHFHILDTIAYDVHCRQAFGKFINHIPTDPIIYEGLTPDELKEDLAHMNDLRSRTLQLYTRNFGELTPQAEAIWKTSTPLKIDFEFMDKIGVGKKSSRKSQTGDGSLGFSPKLGSACRSCIGACR